MNDKLLQRELLDAVPFCFVYAIPKVLVGIRWEKSSFETVVLAKIACDYKIIVAHYEMACRIQSSMSEVMDISNEPDCFYKIYEPDSLLQVTYATNY